MYQELCVHCIVIMNDGGMKQVGGVVDSYQGVGEGTGVGVIPSFLLFVFLSFGLSCPVSFLSE